jgi:cystathionine gamma-lyase
MDDATKVVHAGQDGQGQGEPFLPGPTLAAPYHLAGDVDATPYGYGRDANPTWGRYESALGELEDARAVLFPSGMAAVSAVVLPALKAGDVLVAPADGYPLLREIARLHLEPHGVTVRLVPTELDAYRAALDGATLVWLETPSNPGLDVVAIAELADAVHAAGGALAVDNTLATALGQRPLDHGADLVMTSASKATTGHSDLLMGVVTTRDEARTHDLREWRTRTGAITGPFEAWLAHRSLATLDVRLLRACDNALALSELLAVRDDVEAVRYPGRPGDPAFATAAHQMTRFGQVLNFTLQSAERAQAFLAAARLVTEATSFGGMHTTAERRARWGSDAVAEGFIRLSAGIEATGDLLEDVGAALDATA